jgi:hypothetical protein
VFFQEVAHLRRQLLFLTPELVQIMLERFNLALGLHLELPRFEFRFSQDLFGLFFGVPDPFLPNLLDGHERLLEFILAFLHPLQLLVLPGQTFAQAGILSDELFHVARHQLEEFVDFPWVQSSKPERELLLSDL